MNVNTECKANLFVVDDASRSLSVTQCWDNDIADLSAKFPADSYTACRRSGLLYCALYLSQIVPSSFLRCSIHSIQVIDQAR